MWVLKKVKYTETQNKAVVGKGGGRGGKRKWEIKSKES
jgi:hypothetical protein